MSDRTSATITIAGEITSKAVLDGLVEAANSDNVGTEWGCNDSKHTLRAAIVTAIQNGQRVSFYDCLCNFGRFESLEPFCEKSGLSYARRNDAGDDYSAEAAAWMPGMPRPIVALIDSHGGGDGMISLSEIKPVLDLPVEELREKLMKVVDDVRAALGERLPTALTASAEVVADLD